MASQVCEISSTAFINGDDEVKRMEVYKINGALLTSLMEEISPSDESGQDDRLNSLMRSFEAEILSGRKMDDHDSASTGSGSAEEDTLSWNMGQVDGQEYLDSSSGDEFEVEWVDMEFMPSEIPYYGDCNDEMMADNLVEYDGFAMEEHGYNSFWQESYNLVRCD